MKKHVGTILANNEVSFVRDIHMITCHTLFTKYCYCFCGVHRYTYNIAAVILIRDILQLTLPYLEQRRRSWWLVISNIFS